MKSPSLRPARSFRLLSLLLSAACAVLSIGCGSSPTERAVEGVGGSAPDVTVGASSSGGTGGGVASTPLLAEGIAVGSAHSCALLVTGEVACWGDGSSGQLGDGVAQAGHGSAFAVVVPGLEGVRAVRAGGNTTCAILDSSVMCWGDGAYGQLGDGMASTGHVQASPTKVRGLDGVLDLALSGTTACAVARSGAVLCWGRNTADGWLGFMSNDCGPYQGTGNVATDQPCEKAPRVVPGVSSLAQLEPDASTPSVAAGLIATSGDHSCVVSQGAMVTCWGADDYGQLGDGFSGTGPHDPSPVVVSSLSSVSVVAIGASHSCAIAATDRDVFCWGDNSYGQLGVGTNALDSNETAPVMVGGLAHVVDLDAAASASCAALADGTVRCWGEPTSLFPPSASAMTASPLRASGIGHARLVRTSGTHACALAEDRTVSCWGLNDVGQLGNGQLSLGDYAVTPVDAALVAGAGLPMREALAPLARVARVGLAGGGDVADARAQLGHEFGRAPVVAGSEIHADLHHELVDGALCLDARATGSRLE